MRRDLDFFEILKQYKRYVIALIVLMTIHIYMSGRMDEKVVRYQRLNREVEQLRARYITQLSQLMNMNLESEVSKEIEKRNLNLIKDDLPTKIYVQPIKEQEH